MGGRGGEGDKIEEALCTRHNPNRHTRMVVSREEVLEKGAKVTVVLLAGVSHNDGF